MVAARTAARGLTPADLDGIRESLAAGRRPKVQFTESAGQVAGQLGQVVKLADPAGGDDYVVVRFGRDELPFSPADLKLAPRGSARRITPPAGKQDAGKQGAANGTAPPADGAAPPGPPLRLTEPPRRTTPSRPAPDSSAKARQPAPAEEPSPPRRSARAARPRPPAALTVTLSYVDGEWLVSATQGTRTLAKPYVVRPAEALKMVALLDVPGVREAVEQIVAAERTAAQDQAQRLRSQLAEVEAKLAELGELD